MKRFILLYFTFLALLFSIFYLHTSIVSVTINKWQTDLTLLTLDIFLKPHQLQGTDIWINPHYKIVITQACNGMIPILFLFSSILAYSSSIFTKLIWITIGYIVFTIVNVARILFVVYITQNGNGELDFHWSHDLVGNTLLLATGLSLFILFIKNSRKIKNL